MPANNIKHLMTATIFLSLLLPNLVVAQDSVSLDYCYRQAEKNYPLLRQLDLLSSSNTLKVKNLNKSYLPQVNVNGSASLQSDVTKIAIVLPKGLPTLDMPVLSKDWYKLTVDLNQVIYDGNATRYQKQVEASNLSADQKSVEIELYKLKDRVNQIFFSIIFLQQNELLLKSNRERIEVKYKEVKSAISNGSALEMNGALLEAELVRIDQQLTETRMDRATSYQMLSELISTPVSEKTALVMPHVVLPGMAFEDKRLEYELFDIQRSKIKLMQSMVTTKWNPKIFAYGQAGYGRPGLNMLDDTFKSWWLFGAKLTWNPWNWNQNKNEKQILSIQNDILKTQQETFDKNLKISSQKDQGEIVKLTELLSQDDQVIALRSKITRAASSQLDNGVITASDYISRLNEETLSQLNREMHKIQLAKAQLSYLFTLGKL
jgi:outer membrane protein TolC